MGKLIDQEKQEFLGAFRLHYIHYSIRFSSGQLSARRVELRNHIPLQITIATNKMEPIGSEVQGFPHF